MWSYVDPEIESVVVPIGAMIPAPLPVGLDSITISIDSSAVFPESCRVAIDLGSIGLKPAMAFVPQVPVPKCCLADWKRERQSQRRS